MEAFAAKGSWDWIWRETDVVTFLKKLNVSLRVIQHADPLFSPFILPTTYDNPPILLTQAVLDGLEQEAPDELSVVNGWWREQHVRVAGYEGKVYGGDVYFEVFE